MVDEEILKEKERIVFTLILVLGLIKNIISIYMYLHISFYHKFAVKNFEIQYANLAIHY